MKNVWILIILILSLALGFYIYDSQKKDKLISDLRVKNFELSEDIKALTYTSNSKVQVLYKKENTTHSTFAYIPPENPGYTITTDIDGSMSIQYNKFGLGFYPFVGFGYRNEIIPLLGARLVYFDRFGTGLSIAPNTINLFIDYRPDLSLFKNSSFGLSYDSQKTIFLNWHIFW